MKPTWPNGTWNLANFLEIPQNHRTKPLPEFLFEQKKLKK